MDLMGILRTIRRHKYTSASVLILTIVGVGLVMFTIPPVYKQSSSLVLLQPRADVSPADLAQDPELKDVDPYNPFRGDPSLVIGVLSARLSSDAARQRFEEEGVDPRFELQAAVTYGFARPEIQVTALGDTPEATFVSRRAVAAAVERELEAVQVEQGVHPYFMVQSLLVEPTTEPLEQTSSKLRSIIAVILLGGMALFALLSVATAFDQRREERAAMVGQVDQVMAGDA